MKQMKFLTVFAAAALLFACNSGGDSSSASSSQEASSIASSSSSSSSQEASSVASSSSSSSSQPIVEPAHVTDKSIHDLVTTAPSDNMLLYEVTGIWYPTGAATDQYGNGELYNLQGEKLVVFGMAPTVDAFSFSDTGYSFTNPKAFQSLKSQFDAGDEIVINYKVAA